MCGHVGIAGKLEFKDEATMKRLFVFDYFRGPDSTGLAVLRNTGDIKIAKQACNPLDLFDTGKFKEALTGVSSQVFLGHNRLATKGKVNNLNAHPYHYGAIVGAHNGTLDPASWRKLEEVLEEKFDVDSQAVIYAIDKLGIEETVKHLQGAWALVWINTEEKTLNFLRNKERPMWYAYDKDFDKVFWASEWPMIMGAVEMSTQGYELYKNENGNRFFAMEEDWWYRFDLDALKSYKADKDKPKPRVKVLKGEEPPPAVNYTCGATNFPTPHRAGGNLGTTKKTTLGATTSISTNAVTIVKNNIPDKIEFVGTPGDTTAGFMDWASFRDYAAYGCSWCRADVPYDVPGYTIDTVHDTILCPDCSGRGEQTRIFVKYETIAKLAA